MKHIYSYDKTAQRFRLLTWYLVHWRQFNCDRWKEWHKIIAVPLSQDVLQVFYSYPLRDDCTKTRNDSYCDLFIKS